ASLKETQLASFSLTVDGNPVAEVQTDTLGFMFVGSQQGIGMHRLTALATDTAGVQDSVRFAIMVNPPPNNVPAPASIVDGFNPVDNSTVTLSLYAPFKKFVYVIGDFNDWQVDEAFLMNRDEVTQDSVRFWLTVSNLDPDVAYGYQYLVDGELRIADPYTELVLDPFNDQFIDNQTFPNLKPYPQGKTDKPVSVFKIDESQYQWQVETFQRPEKKDLVIYELLVRDFVAAHNYQTLVDTLAYLQRLGVNAVELMPVNEFEGNISWGYNPSFYFAPDKYYGTKNALKRFVDEAHKRGLAVILDVVLNHSFGQSSFVRLYSEGDYGPPTPENPWYNPTPRHPFNVGFDFNHESPATKALVDRVLRFWLTEYRVDGFRFDLSKGFTQRFSTDDSQFRRFDQSRIDILERMATKMWQVDSTAYVILEHFAENSEEIVLSDFGMMLWQNMNVAYSQSAMGWLSDPQRSSD
ncbi:MAG: alpha-amylase, partial [Calditrichaeota bacterium]